MQRRQYDAPRPNDAPAAPAFRPRHQLSIAVGAAILAITLASCGSGNTRRGTDPQATPAAETAQQDHATNPRDSVQLPDLTDPATRKQFVCSFADGYFTGSQKPADDSKSSCR